MSLLSRDYIDYWINEGFAFLYDQVATLPSATNKYFLFDPTAVPDDTRIHVFPLRFFNVEDGPCYVNYYVGHDYTGGTPLTFLNRNGNSANTAKVAANEDPTGTSLGLKTSSNKISIGGTLPSQSGGGSTLVSDEFIASNKYTFLIEVVNDSGADVDAEAYLTWAEVPEQYN